MVYDISKAREARRMRKYIMLSPIGDERPNVLSFQKNEPICRTAPVLDQEREGSTSATEGPFDHPPAA